MIEVRGLSYRYQGEPRDVLVDVDLEVGPGERVLVVGPNGAGKTTLLRVLAGKHMVSPETVRVLGSSAFHDTSLSGRVEYLGGAFPFTVDLRVSELLAARPNVDPQRRARLIEVLGVDPGWRMHAVSDGQRRRVQILLGLLRPVEVLLLDEITTDLDLLARHDLLAFLAEESRTRQTTILYASHILDGLDAWATRLVYLDAGRITREGPLDELAELAALRAHSDQPLLALVLGWLRADAGR